MTFMEKCACAVGETGYEAEYVPATDGAGVAEIVLMSRRVAERRGSWLVYTNGTKTNGSRYPVEPAGALWSLHRRAEIGLNIARHEEFDRAWIFEQESFRACLEFAATHPAVIVGATAGAT